MTSQGKLYVCAPSPQDARRTAWAQLITVTDSYPGGAQWALAQPIRVLDTRTASGGAAWWGAGSTHTVRVVEAQDINATTVQTTPDLIVPRDARGVTLNVTAVDPLAAGHVCVYGGGPRPSTSTLNYGPGVTVANCALVVLGGLTVSVFTSAATHVLVDVLGYFR